jgi:hypothetical protein
MSRLPSILVWIADQRDVSRRIAEQRTASLRTVERMCAAGKIHGAYRTRGGQWRVRRLPAHDVETVLKLQRVALLHELKGVLFPHFDEVMELSYVLAGIANDDVLSVQHPSPAVRAANIEKLKTDFPQKWKLLCCRDLVLDPEKIRLMRQGLDSGTRLWTKGEILRLHGYPVNRGTLADILRISRPTLNKRFDPAVVQKVCDRRPSGYGELPGLFRYQKNRQKIY